MDVPDRMYGRDLTYKLLVPEFCPPPLKIPEKVPPDGLAARSPHNDSPMPCQPPGDSTYITQIIILRGGGELLVLRT